MLELFDKSLRKLAILQNASGIIETKNLNAIYLMEFQLPADDPKNEFCLPFHHVRYNGGELYRIMALESEVTETATIRYQCEHVIASLLDDVMFGFHQVGNIGYYTDEVIRYALTWQTSQRWTLDRCDMRRQFEYGWEQENLLGAIFSIPKPSVQPYMWTYDTQSFPFRLSLVELNENALPSKYIRRGDNRLTLNRQSDPRQLCTRLYALGAGEGVNQLGISDVNSGLPYVQSPQSYIDKYGLITRIWIDRRYTDAQSLLEAAQAMLDELQEPIIEYAVSVNEPCELGSVVKIVETGTNHIVTGVTTTHSEIPSYEIRIANRARNIAETVADLADRQRIEMTYAQGATQLFGFTGAGNADSKSPLNVSFELDPDLVNVNYIHIKVRIEPFRAYSKTTSSGGSVQTSSSGGSTSTSTSSGGGTYTSTDSGGASQQTEPQKTSGPSSKSSSDGYTTGQVTTVSTLASSGRASSVYTTTNENHSHQIMEHAHYMPSYGHAHNIAHTHTLPGFTISIPSHSHSFSISTHTHSLTIGTHTHSLDTTHSHNIQPVIERFGNPSGFWIIAKGNNAVYINGTDGEIDITEYLIVDSKLPRTWHTIGILPNDLAYISLFGSVKGFVQSRGNRTL